MRPRLVMRPATRIKPTKAGMGRIEMGDLLTYQATPIGGVIRDGSSIEPRLGETKKQPVKGEHLEKIPNRIDRSDVVAGDVCTCTTAAIAAGAAIAVGVWNPRGTHSVSARLAARIHGL